MRISATYWGGLALSLSVTMLASPAIAACDADALGTHRTIALDPADHQYLIGHERKLGLRDGEVILTFDDGPIAGRTTRILEALGDECVKATFFAVGKMARAYPKIAKRIVNQGHTLAHHTHNHDRLPKFSVKRASKLIDKGVALVEKAAYGKVHDVPLVPFFRFPYLAHNKAIDRMVARKGMIAFDANIDSRDWKKVSPSAVHNKIMKLLKKKKKGIILMHDIQHRTAKMLPRLLRSLKDGGYKVVHIVPPKGAPTAKPEDPVVVARLDQADTGIPALPSSREKPAAARMIAGKAVSNLVANSIPEAVPPVAQKPRRSSIVTLDSPIGELSKAQSEALVASALAEVGAPKADKPRRAEKARYVPQPPEPNRLVRQALSTKGWKLRASQWILR